MSVKAEILIGIKNSKKFQIGLKGLTIELPAFVDVGKRLVVKAKPIYNALEIHTVKHERISFTVKSCDKIDNAYRVKAEFSNALDDDLQAKLIGLGPRGKVLESQVVLVFRDVAYFNKMHELGLILTKKNEIKSDFIFHFRHTDLLSSIGMDEKSSKQVQLYVKSCVLREDGLYEIDAHFKNISEKALKNVKKFATEHGGKINITKALPKKADDAWETENMFEGADEDEEEAMSSGGSEINYDLLLYNMRNNKLKMVEAENFSYPFFVQEAMGLKNAMSHIKSVMKPFAKDLQKVAEAVFPKVDDKFTIRKYEHMRQRREQCVTFKVELRTLEVYFQLCAILTALPKGMGVSASLVEDNYKYEPFFTFGVNGQDFTEFDKVLEKKSIDGKMVQMYRYSNKSVLDIVEILIGNLKAEHC